MGNALKGRYAVGYFESWNLESLQGTIDAAESVRAPIIIGFNGEFLSRAGRRAEERLSWYAELGKEAARSASVPCGLIFNECANDEWVERAAMAGFNLVMPADAAAIGIQGLRHRAFRQALGYQVEAGLHDHRFGGVADKAVKP